MADFNPPWADDASASKNFPTDAQRNAGFQCGPADMAQFNALFHALQAEMGNVIGAAGLAGSDSDFAQVKQAIAHALPSASAFTDSGAANAYVLTGLNPLGAPSSLYDGLSVGFLPANANSGAATVDVAGLGAKPVVLADGSALGGGELVSDRYVTLRYVAALDSFALTFGGVDNGNRVPAGAIMAFPFVEPPAPAGWIECGGAAISRTTFADLFAAIGTTFGAGDGSTTFNIPDLRGEFIRGWDHGRGVDWSRAMGSWQHGSHMPHDTDSREVHGLASRTAALEHGLEPPEIATTSSQTWVSWPGHPGTPGYNVGNNFYAAIRVRNRALMFCIKYTA